MLFLDFSKYLARIETETSRLKMTEILADLFKQMSPKESRYAVYLLQGQILPPFFGYDFNIGEKTILNILESYTRDAEKIFQKTGDLGLTTEYVLKHNYQNAFFKSKLDIIDVYNLIYKISKISGEGSQNMRKKYLLGLLNNCSPIEAKYVVRIISKNLRLGFADATILDALSWLKKGDKTLREMLERAYNVRADLGYVVEVFLSNPELVKSIDIEPFIPLRPALAERLKNVHEIYEKLGKCAVDFKYDGFRMQVHKKGNEVRIFSRKLERIDYMFPDIKERIKELNIDRIIFEGEALAFNQKEDKFFTFQETMHRRRKYGIKKASEEWPLNLYIFDVMFNGESLIDKPFIDRRKYLESIELPENIYLTHLEIANNEQDIKRMFDTALSKNLEGIIAKKLDAPYKAGKRDFVWIKLKKSYGKEIDTIDGVIVGYYRGTGSRTNLLGGVLLAVYNDELDRFETIAKVGSGFTEEEMMDLLERLERIKIQTPDKNLFFKQHPDFWVKPEIVIEVAYDEITNSPLHTCSYEDGKGLSLRFPRFVRFRFDKSKYNITTSNEVREMKNEYM